jgi:hypothetical protein
MCAAHRRTRETDDARRPQPELRAEGFVVGRALFRAVQAKRPAPGLIHHADRGRKSHARD